MLTSIFIICVILLCLWIAWAMIDRIPVPPAAGAPPSPLKWILFALAGCVAIYLILQAAGIHLPR